MGDTGRKCNSIQFSSCDGDKALIRLINQRTTVSLKISQLVGKIRGANRKGSKVETVKQTFKMICNARKVKMLKDDLKSLQKSLGPVATTIVKRNTDRTVDLLG